MKNYILLLLISLMPATFAVAQDLKIGDVRVLENKILNASMRGDSAELNKRLTDDYVSVGTSGHVRSRSEIIKAYTDGSLKISSVLSEPQTVRQYGSIAIVVGSLTISGTDSGKDISGRYEFTRVYRNEAGNWRAVSFESTPVK